MTFVMTRKCAITNLFGSHGFRSPERWLYKGCEEMVCSGCSVQLLLSTDVAPSTVGVSSGFALPPCEGAWPKVM